METLEWSFCTVELSSKPWDKYQNLTIQILHKDSDGDSRTESDDETTSSEKGVLGFPDNYICDSVCMIGRLEGCPLSQVYNRSSTARAIEVPAVYKATPHTWSQLLCFS